MIQTGTGEKKIKILPVDYQAYCSTEPESVERESLVRSKMNKREV